MEPEVFSYIDGDSTYFELEPLTRLSADGKLGVYRHYGYWQCLDTARDRNALDELWNKGEAPWKVWEE